MQDVLRKKIMEHLRNCKKLKKTEQKLVDLMNKKKKKEKTNKEDLKKKTKTDG